MNPAPPSCLQFNIESKELFLHPTIPKAESPKPLAQSPETIQYSVEEPNEEPEHPQHTVSKGSTIEQTNLNPKAQDPVGPPTRGRQTPVPPPPKNEGAVVPPLPDMSMYATLV